MERVDLIITGEFVLKGPSNPPISNGAVAVLGDRIESVGKKEEVLSHYTAPKILERPTGLVIPGLFNAHTHVPMTLFRGLADDLPLKTWLEEYIFPMEARLTPELVALGTELACAEMIRSGITSFIDMYLFEETISEVVARVGLRAWLGEGLFDFPTPAFSSGFDALKETERLIEKWKGHPLITITVDPHTPYTCAPDLLRQAGKMADKTRSFLVIHLAETAWEDQEIRTRYNVSPVRHLDNLGLLGENTLAVHGVHLHEKDLELIKKRGVKLVHCPQSNLKLASGVAPVKKALDFGIPVLLGTDGATSNNNLDMFEEMGTCAMLAKGVTGDPTAVSAKDTFSMVTSIAARSLGREDLGVLEPGACCDIVVLDLERPHLRPCYNPVSQLVYCARGGDVTDVIVGGRILMEGGELTTIDEERLLNRIKRINLG